MTMAKPATPTPARSITPSRLRAWRRAQSPTPAESAARYRTRAPGITRREAAARLLDHLTRDHRRELANHRHYAVSTIADNWEHWETPVGMGGHRTPGLRYTLALWRLLADPVDTAIAPGHCPGRPG